MKIIDGVIESVISFLPLLATAAVFGVLLWVAYRLLIRRHASHGNEHLFPRQLAMLGLSLVSILAVALALPVSESVRNQVIGLLGLLISGVLALSASTIFANLMAGIMLRVTKPFRTGDFVSVQDHFGRVTARGLLDTEIQTENRDLVALPNTYLITNPVSVVRTSGTIISVTLSLGYDIHHSRVEPLLLDAVAECDLKEPFVRIIEIGNYSITYKASGMLTDVKYLLTARSNLFRSVLDTLHNSGIEIVSPSFMNQRHLPEGGKIIPPRVVDEPTEEPHAAEEVIFDKAERAEQFETRKLQCNATIEWCKACLENAPATEKKRIEKVLQDALDRLDRLNKMAQE